MGSPDERIAYLLEAYTSQKATPKEEQELMHWMQEAEEDGALKAYMQKLWDQYQPGRDFSYVNWDSMFSRIIPQEKTLSVTKTPRIYRWPKVAAAAAAILLMGTVAYFWQIDKETRTPVVEKNQGPQPDRMPGHDGAILTLADGSRMVLDSLGNGKIATQNGGEVILDKGQLTYVATGKPSGAITYNTMSTPNGRQFKLTLPDGTGVWLNSASSIRYPTAFAGANRKVTITGEAYFEVAKHEKMPFMVNVNDKAEIQVLGTHFNVNAYQDQELVKTTLLEGAVRIQAEKNQQRLTPGQQAQVADNAPIRLVENVDLEQVVAWKNGLFNFNNEDIRSVMEEIGRWYDMEIVYESIPEQREITGEMQRNLSLTQVMNVLKKLRIHYRLEERKLIITK